MYAVIETQGRQYNVAAGQTLQVDRLDATPGAEITIDRVLLLSTTDGVTVGAPTVDGATVTATVLSHEKGDKVTTFKYRRRKRYRKMRGFRASLSTIQVTTIALGGDILDGVSADALLEVAPAEAPAPASTASEE